jgi:hypothetical protein
MLTLICSNANSRLHVSVSLMARSFSVSTPVVINLLMRNLAFIKLGFIARVLATRQRGGVSGEFLGASLLSHHQGMLH